MRNRVCLNAIASFLPFRSASDHPLSRLGLARTLRVTGDDLDAVGMNLMGIVQLEVDILDNKGPYVVAEAVGIEMSLRSFKSAHDASH